MDRKTDKYNRVAPGGCDPAKFRTKLHHQAKLFVSGHPFRCAHKPTGSADVSPAVARASPPSLFRLELKTLLRRTQRETFRGERRQIVFRHPASDQLRHHLRGYRCQQNPVAKMSGRNEVSVDGS